MVENTRHLNLHLFSSTLRSFTIRSLNTNVLDFTNKMFFLCSYIGVYVQMYCIPIGMDHLRIVATHLWTWLAMRYICYSTLLATGDDLTIYLSNKKTIYFRCESPLNYQYTYLIYLHKSFWRNRIWWSFHPRLTVTVWYYGNCGSVSLSKK